MKSQAFIAVNSRNTQKPKTFGPHGAPLCSYGLEMSFNGAWHEGKRDRIKFRCPIKVSKKIAKTYPNGCPIKNPKFFEGAAYGCTKHLDVTNDARNRVSRHSTFFKETYKKRIVVEQYFSRLGEREVEQTTHYKLRVIKNQMSIAHLSMSLIALAAAHLQCPDKIRCYRTFANAG